MPPQLLTDTRLLTVTGPGGAGKTRFALELCRRQSQGYPDGVHWVPLATLTDPDARHEMRSARPWSYRASRDADRRPAPARSARQPGAAGGRRARARECSPSAPTSRLSAPPESCLRVQPETEYSAAALAAEDGLSLFCDRAGLEASDTIARALRTPGGLAAGDRAGGSPNAPALTRAAAGPALSAARPAHGRAGRRSAPADPAGDDRLVLRAADSRGAAPLRPPRSLLRRLHAGGGRSGLRSRDRRVGLATRSEPRSQEWRSLHDAGDDPRVRWGEARSESGEAGEHQPAARGVGRSARREQAAYAGISGSDEGSAGSVSSIRSRETCALPSPGSSRPTRRDSLL